MQVCVCLCVRACVRLYRYVCVCVRARACMCVSVYVYQKVCKLLHNRLSSTTDRNKEVQRQKIVSTCERKPPNGPMLRCRMNRLDTVECTALRQMVELR